MAREAPTAFFSYSVKAAGASGWIDQLDIKPGEEWDTAIEAAVARSPRMLVILSPTCTDAPNVRNEISFALNANRTIIPVLYQDCTVPLQLTRVHYLLTGPLTLSAVLRGPERQIVGDAYPTGDNASTSSSAFSMEMPSIA